MFLLASVAGKLQPGLATQTVKSINFKTKILYTSSNVQKTTCFKVGEDIITVFQAHRHSWCYILNKLPAANTSVKKKS